MGLLASDWFFPGLDLVDGYQIETGYTLHHLVRDPLVGDDDRAFDPVKHVRAIATEQHIFRKQFRSVSRLEGDVDGITALIVSDKVSPHNRAIYVAIGVLIGVRRR